MLLAAAFGWMTAAPCPAFEPARQFPDTSDTIRVFVDQLSENITRAQMHFAATQYVGTQKLLARQIDAMRRFNPKFLMLQYRMGVRQPDPSILHIQDNRWANDWVEIDRHDDWFIHTRDPVPKRVYQLVGKNREYVMDISGRINGNPTNGWKEYWVKTVIESARASHADGVFADSTHPPYAVPPELNNSPLGAPPYESYLQDLEVFYDYAYRELDRADLYFIPNVGHLINTWDTTSGYYEDVHGAMVEGFGFHGNTEDWKLQQNRTLRLLRNGKIYIAQMDIPSESRDRLWYLANFLLVKHNRSYINMFPHGYGLEGQLHWWPEYELSLGRQVHPEVPKDIDALRHGSGVYFREYEKGLVLVNPTRSPLTVRLAGTQQYQRVTPVGGGLVDSLGRVPKGSLQLDPQPKEVDLEPWSGVILLKAEAAASPP